MKLTVVCQVYNELQTGNLQRFMANMSEFADGLVIYNDGSTDETHKYLDAFYWGNKCNWDCASVGYTDGFTPPRLNPDDTYFIGSPTNDFKNEMAHKQQMLEIAVERIKSDWILWLDADEVIEPRGLNGGIRSLLDNTELDGYAFHQINMWRSDRFYRLDNQFNDGIFVRLWRNNGRLRFEPKPGLHQRPYPLGVDKVADSDIQIIHYGFASDDAIIRKYHTYKEHGQAGWALDRLVDESTLAMRRIKPEWLCDQPVGPDLEVFNTRVADKV